MPPLRLHLKNSEIMKNTSKPKALFIGPYPPPYSGPETAMKTFLESDLTDRFDIAFLNTNVRTSNEQKGKIDATIVKAFYLFVSRLIRVILREKPKVAYYFVTATRIGWLGRDIWCILICRMLGVPLVVHMRAGHFKRNFNAMSSAEKAVIRFACRRVARALVQAERLRNQFEGLVPDERVHFLYNAVDTEKYHNPEPEKFEEFTVFFMGHLSHAKGYCDILKAIPKLAEKYPKLRILFAGNKLKAERNVFFNEATGEKISFEDPDACWQEHIAGKYEAHYEYLGTVNDAEKIEIFKLCNFFLLPSYSEGFSMAILEAVSMAKPVLCTPVGALGEIVHEGENGLLVVPGNVDELTEKMDALLSDTELRNAMARRNHAYAREVFDVAHVSSRLGDHLVAVMKSN